MRLIWRSAPNEGEVRHATRIEIKGRDLSAYRAGGAMHTNDPDLIILEDDMRVRPFQALSDEMLDDLAAALDSAAGEGAFGNEAIADALCAEFVARNRMMPAAYSDDRLSPDEWKRWLDGI